MFTRTRSSVGIQRSVSGTPAVIGAKRIGTQVFTAAIKEATFINVCKQKKMVKTYDALLYKANEIEVYI